MRLRFVNSLPESSFVSRASSAIDISRRVTGLVTVNGNNREGRIDFL
jgi:hypothetical protein